ncbi:MAG: HAD-IIIA family hydrolase [Acetobacter sp.]|nr:HAD-IIIA family hydrolase [Bacteroides sp.]MCM1341328.1 HAD-IIIA family hydrolase [Acetobacter sp.]MCM1433420.1 HAD-IIIA family hydrolase [Clostridiales bacterium]
MIKCALFDLDGTLIDTITDLGRAVDYCLEKYGYNKKWTSDDYKLFVGNGAVKLLERAFENKLSDKEFNNVYAMFKEKYNQILLDNAKPYEKIPESLDALKKKGIKLAVVTNKPHASAVMMVESVFGKNYFDAIVGADDNTPKKPDPYSANKALSILDCKASEAIYFGDSDVDVYTAKNAGIEAVACSWGFRSFECLFAAGPSVIIDSADYIAKLF